MAKRKGAVALFEVIHKDKRFARSNPSALSTPSWWFKGKGQGQFQPPPAPPQPETAPDVPALVAPPAHIPVETPIDDSTEPTALTQNANDSWPAVPSTDSLGPLESAPRPHHLNDEPREGKVTWTSGVIIGGTAVCVIALGMILTRHPRSASAGTSASGQHDVLNVGVGAVGSGTPVLVPVPQNDNSQNGASPAPRQKGLLYALIQWYPNQQDAIAASAVLSRNGIANTIERNLKIPEVPRDAFAVVGLDWYIHPDSRKLRLYMANIKSISAQLDANPRGFNAFHPVMITWTQSDASQANQDSSAGRQVP